MKTLLLSIILLFTVEANAQIVNIPDANFKACLVARPEINTNFDTEIQVSEANAYAGEIHCFGANISSLVGIEEFPLISWLSCQNNNLTSLDVSSNTALIYLYCFNNNLTSLDLSNNTDLKGLLCQNNNLTSLDVSSNTMLDNFYCENNNLTSLDFSNNTVLSQLICFNNNLTSLDLSNNMFLSMLDCSNNNLTCLNVKNGNNWDMNFRFETTNNPNLTCIEVDDVAWSNANWTDIDPQTSFSTSCNNACTSTIGIEELSNSPKQLLKIVDLMGRETPFKPNTVLIYVYDDGSTERVFKLEE